MTAIHPYQPGATPLVPRQPHDALGRLLAASTSWKAVPATVTWLVTATSWAALALDVLLVMVAGGARSGIDLLDAIGTAGNRPDLVGAMGLVAAILMVVIALATQAYRRANHAWLRVWMVGFIASAIAMLPVLAAVLTGLLIVVVVLVVGLAIAALVLAVVVG